MASNIAGTRWPMALGIHAGKAFMRAENALSRIQATAVASDYQVIADLRVARCELNHLAKEISRLIRELEDPARG